MTPGSQFTLQINDTCRIVAYDNVPPHEPQSPPLLLIHSVNAAASAFEMEPLIRRHAPERRVVAFDLPGFGASDKPDLRCSPQLMQRAIRAVLDWIDAPTVDIVALSLACEFATEAVLQRPGPGVRSLALISPTAMERKRKDERWQDGQTREVRWLRRLLRDSSVGRPLYRLLTTRASMRWFLGRTWGTPNFDPRLLNEASACAALPGAHHAPLDFISGALFTRGIIERYRLLDVPLWVCHGTKGSFTDFDACPERNASGMAVERTVLNGGAMPHFELPDAFDAAYRQFLQQVGAETQDQQQVPVPQPPPDVVPTPQPMPPPPPPAIPPNIVDPPLSPQPPAPVIDPHPQQPAVGGLLRSPHGVTTTTTR